MFHGSLGDVPLAHDVVAIASAPTGQGYYLVDAGGGVFTFGDANFVGSTGAIPLNEPIVAIAGSRL